ncbi:MULTISPECIES: hypothetical protein [Halorussus]|uniref:hypothetical protein n=1 Tax=Halorussus TaxID=1070314 RepID=UPI000E2162A8|nr:MULTISPECIES: hypothetical protein [Halorussus]NHN57821.1 hypothetical protein [Halorussus sp. JP-T4]
MRTATVTLAAPLLATLLLAALLPATVVGAPALAADQSGVSCEYDESRLKAYQPETDVDHLAVRPTASYAGIFSSPEHPTDVYVYFLRYSHQEGVTPVDSHADDHEPVYVLVDERTGEVRRVVFSVYHYIKETGTPATLPMNGSHVKLHVVEPWHQYAPTTESGSRVRLRNYCEAVDRWHAEGWDASVAATTNPWTMLDRKSWWARNSLGFSLAERYWDARQSVAEAVPDVNVSFPAREPGPISAG